MRERGIDPAEEIEAPEAADLPGIGEVEERETIYATSIDEVFREDDRDIFGSEDGRLEQWWREIENIVTTSDVIQDLRPISKEPLEPHCAWYLPDSLLRA